MRDLEKTLLRVRGLSKRFGDGCPSCRTEDGKVRRGALQKNYCPRCSTVYALDDVRFDVFENEVVGIVGESGSGKSTLMKCLYFEQEATTGEVFLDAFDGGVENVLSLSPQKKTWIRNFVLGMVYQNPVYGLKMKFSAIANIAEKLICAGKRHVGAMNDRACELLEHVAIPIERRKEAPEHFSGGMQQRVQIAKALSNRPPLLFLDEVTTGLDVSVQAKVLDLIKQLRRELSIGMILVSHDLTVVRMLADRTLVMLDGQIVEHGLTDQILEDPQHPYTQELVHSLL